MKKHRSSQNRDKSRPSGHVAQRAQQISATANQPDDPNIHHWLKAEAESNWQRHLETAVHRTVRADPKNPL